MIHIPPTLPTSNTEGLKSKSTSDERVSRIEKLQDVNERKKSKQQRSNSDQSKSHKRLNDNAEENTEENTQDDLPVHLKEKSHSFTQQHEQKEIRASERRLRIERRKNNSKNFLIDSRSSRGRRSQDDQHPTVDIEV